MIRAKFYVASKTVTAWKPGGISETGQVTLQPVTGGGSGSEENKAFWNATPSGEIKMHISNPDAFKAFEAGQTYYVDFTEAPAE